MSDWRLQGQEKYLKGVILELSSYKPSHKDSDHDHCEFCSAKFSEVIMGALKEGYKTQDGYRWICSSCFEDFKNTFNWIIKD
ncbi:MAG: hypothetical protein H6620_10505 [Halobacteriovoraceae bacterium]|nr:hypothetical protein [Halobacteriovoraceae bacterium]